MTLHHHLALTRLFGALPERNGDPRAGYPTFPMLVTMPAKQRFPLHRLSGISSETSTLPVMDEQMIRRHCSTQFSRLRVACYSYQKAHTLFQSESISPKGT